VAQRVELRIGAVTGPKLGLSPPILTLPGSATGAGFGRICIYIVTFLVLLHVISCGGDEDRLKLLLDDVQDGATKSCPAMRLLAGSGLR
jgi:hypothetical protein